MRILGIAMIVALFAMIFVATARIEGWWTTLLIFLGAIGGAVWIMVGCYWAVRG